MKRNKESDILHDVRAAIFEVFGDYISGDARRALKIIKEATFLADEDPGQWAPNAAAVIHCESGIPNGLYDGLYEKWFNVSAMLKSHYCEHINAAVIAVYPAR